MNRVRVRQHVNPLGIKYQTPINPIDWENIYLDQNKPLLLDIGCARGQFLIEMAQLEPNWNFLGLEIREPLVEAANKTRSELRLTNLHYLFCNANNSLKPLLSSLPKGILQRVTIQFPDPWFKHRHAKRRVAQPQLVAELADYLAPGGNVFLQSDVKFVAVEMCERFQQNSAFHRESKEWLVENPLNVATERELFTLEKNQPVYRALFTRVEI
ncbi:MAG: tRNA (guanosine(46)-N7)-methyltransferase TrmB [Nostocales cyanobacterium 94392]|nr:tRNA (guanosine(46)-N7)-methyltransferase TrmB [Nostocales cyanobacterium 94392]